VVALSATAVLMSVVAVAMRRSRWRISMMSSAAPPAQRAWLARARTNGAQQPRGGVGVELSGRPAGQQLGQQHV